MKPSLLVMPAVLAAMPEEVAAGDGAGAGCGCCADAQAIASVAIRGTITGAFIR
jgi:hypothetical protein